MIPQNEGATYSFEIVEQMLKGYKELKRVALQLEFEIKHYIPITTGEDIIDAMTFGKSEEEGVSFIQKGSVSDKIANIAVSYKEKSVRLNKWHRDELERSLRLINVELLRIEYYIGLLGGKHSKVLKMLYLDELTYIETAEKIKVSTTSIKKLRKAAIGMLVEMYNTLAC